MAVKRAKKRKAWLLTRFQYGSQCRGACDCGSGGVGKLYVWVWTTDGDVSSGQTRVCCQGKLRRTRLEGRHGGAYFADQKLADADVVVDVAGMGVGVGSVGLPTWTSRASLVAWIVMTTRCCCAGQQKEDKTKGVPDTQIPKCNRI
jgi:hypothetical protein